VRSILTGAMERQYLYQPDNDATCMEKDLTKTQRFLLYTGAAVVGMSLAFFGVAAAQDAQPTPTDSAAAAESPAPVVLDIRNDGSALIRGTVTAVNDGSVTVDSWGGS
jgi:hypothetical protein